MNRSIMQPALAVVAAAMLLSGCAAVPEEPAQSVAITNAERASWRDGGTAYLGLSLRENAALKATLINWVMPGPLRPTGEKSALVARGDILLAVDGKPMPATQLRPYVLAKKPGDVIELKVRRTGGKPDGALPAPGAESKEITIKATLAAREEWCGPVEFREERTRPRFSVPSCEEKTWTGYPAKTAPPFPASAFIENRVNEHSLRDPIAKLLELFRQTSGDLGGSNILPAVREAFSNPHQLPEIETSLASAFTRAGNDPRLAIAWAWAMRGRLERGEPKLPANSKLARVQVSDGEKTSDFVQDESGRDVESILKSKWKSPWTAPREPSELTSPTDALTELSKRLAQARAELALAVPLNEGNTRADYQRLRGRLEQMLEISSGAGGIDDDRDPRPAIAAMRASMSLDYESLHHSAAILAAYFKRGKSPDPQSPVTPIPGELRAAVTGDILAAQKIDGQWLVYGGFGSNTYDLDKIAIVIDPAGDDVYRSKSSSAPQVQLVVDMAGNDQYLAEKLGPACGFMGISLIVDYQGNDRYRGADLACGVGVWGVGMIVDGDGEDTYDGKSWSEGAGIYGFGAIIEMGARRDEYHAHTYSQAIGGPGGIGLILDQGGNDWYVADGPVPSAYGEANIRFAMSQGIGFGVRGYDSGGIGMLLDLSGNDRYEAGEFSQGGGYYWGLGILHDRAGDDVYYANRYSQGFGCHQALGVLDDESGNDVYFAMVAASQGGAWDIAMGLLIDRAGNDSYRADGISQGSAAMQAIGWLIDFAGADHYQSSSTAAQGQGSSNSYHYARTLCGSWSMLLDGEGDRDFYSSGRANGKTLATGAANEKQPEESTLHGLFISVPGKVDWSK